MSESSAYTRPLRSLLWELTLRCNLRCMHCGSSAGRARADELSLEACFEVAADILELGCEDITFIGGEIFLYQGWEHLARHFTDHGVAVNIMTNAYGMGPQQIQQIQYAGLENVGVSLDGMARNHNRIRGRADAFDHVIHAFELLEAARIPIGVVTSLFAWNVDDLEALYKLLEAHRVQVWQLQLVNPMGHMARHPELILDRARIPELTDFVREKQLERRMAVVAADSIGYFDANEMYIRGYRKPLLYWEGCQAGLTSAYIDSVGNVKGCGALYDDCFVEGNLRQRRLQSMWADPKAFAYNRAFDVEMLTGHCRRCAMGELCRGGCRASNHFCKGSLYENAFCHGCYQPQEALACVDSAG